MRSYRTRAAYWSRVNSKRKPKKISLAIMKFLKKRKEGN